MERPRVLVVGLVDDDAERVRVSVESDGYELSFGRTADEGRERIRGHEVDILLLDPRIGDRESVELISNVRTKYRNVPHQVVLFAGSADGWRKIIDLSADDFISRDAQPAELQARMTAATIRLLGQRDLFRECEHFRNAIRREEQHAARLLDRHLYLEQAFRSILSMKEELERSNERLEQIAKYDILSGLMNRMSLFTTMDVEIERSSRTTTPLSGFMTDIDNFKSINDNYGHPYGDQVIREVGKRLGGVLRKYDCAGRYGGEEFFIVLPNTRLKQATDIAERFREALCQIPIAYAEERLAVTASVGVAEYGVGENRDLWVSRADRAMYLAKQRGRNRTVALAE